MLALGGIDDGPRGGQSLCLTSCQAETNSHHFLSIKLEKNLNRSFIGFYPKILSFLEPMLRKYLSDKENKKLECFATLAWKGFSRTSTLA
jgi:hypothetical protein